MKKKGLSTLLPLLISMAVLVLGSQTVQLTMAGSARAGELRDTGHSEEGMERVYGRGIDAFNGRDHIEAIFWFDLFLDAFPEARLAGNALYWKGEAYYSMKEYGIAAEAFAEVLRRFPKGDKAGPATLKLGLSYLAMGDNNKGKKYLRKVISTFPGTDSASQAQRRLKSLGRNK